MPIPDFQTIMLPLLTFTADTREHSLRESIEALAEQFALSDTERAELLPSGRQAMFDNRVGWASFYLKKSGLLESTKRGSFRITERGQDVLRQAPSIINIRYLDQFPGFSEFRTSSPEKQSATNNQTGTCTESTPEEMLETAYQGMRQGVAAELLQTIKSCSPAFFERLVIDVLVTMGYGGTRKDAGTAVGKSGDGGIDGIIKEDRLGLDTIYIQAKRWENPVGRPEIQKFAGALQGQRAKKGVFITTSAFTSEAQDYVSRIDNKIVLIDGNLLANLMIDHNVGVSPLASYELKRVDTDYFTEE
ncbi:restriction endonuclease [Geobacter sp. AOG2]|uniref:restriction endonuclease n=1 Tax=Geobacter sp. AOG2 TaxID=1566347 RepID=UPI001CC49ED6|nr:restriction endonuclease [Geobacter sp. AOG2]GFE62432.1 restriction endonuclease [Geobacter sp. AOG2]